VVEAHHIQPWSEGGRTVLGNLVLLHEWPCHKQITAADARRYGWRRSAFDKHEPGQVPVTVVADEIEQGLDDPAASENLAVGDTLVQFRS
jgi:hypothetical protein